MIRTTPGDPESIDILFLDQRGVDLTPAAPAPGLRQLRDPHADDNEDE